MPQLLTHSRNSLADYAVLRKKVEQTLLLGQKKIERQKVLTYFETGKHLHDHIFQNEGRKEHYGSDVIKRLADDLEMSSTVLYQSLQFFRSFKNLHARVNSLPISWAHYRAAMRVSDEKERYKVIETAAKEEWTSRDLEVEVRNRSWTERVARSEDKKPASLPFVCVGPFYTYQMIQPADSLLIDLGFSVTLEAGRFGAEAFKAGTLVSVSPKEKLQKLPVSNGDPASLLYTYKAKVEKILDGDTLKLEIDLGFGMRIRETVRLNYIDCPEMDTPEGKAAKRFVESQLANIDFVTVKSIKTRKEKWGRYLADIFLSSHSRRSVNPEKPIYKPVGKDKLSTGSTQATRLEYLNQLLLDKGHAVRIRN